jgi:alpha-L-fucosidase 2
MSTNRLLNLSLLFLLLFLQSCRNEPLIKVSAAHDLNFNALATVWDEAIPLGNGMLGALVWQKGDHLRISLDRADLWDLRPMENLSKPEFSFKWVQQQVKNNNYKVVQEMFDAPYDQLPAPSKIPGAALEFDTKSLGEVKQVKLELNNALCETTWKNGAKLQTFVHASQPVGWFRFEGIPDNFSPELVPPQYRKVGGSTADSPVTGQDLQRLGYEQGKVVKEQNKLVYRQKGWNGFEYEVAVAWKYSGNTLVGAWTITTSFSEKEVAKTAGGLVSVLLNKTEFVSALQSHAKWWEKFWGKSAISIPDTVLEKQWYLEQYKFGSAARPDAPPISLQAVWTADNGKLPPWKGDFHHDLNTQLSYWPAYSANHLDLEEGFLDWLWKYRPTFKKYTKDYFGVGGMNVPGVTTLTGEPMGGWIQYSFGPTVGCWLAQHFYLHWLYSNDREFLREKAYPWLSDVAVFLDEISVKDENGMLKLPISSSPEIHDNSIKAWFSQTTNFDLAFIRWTFEKTAELAEEMGKTEEAAKWKSILKEWPAFALDNDGGMAFAPGHSYVESHRHFSHLVGWHPLGVIDWSNGEKDQAIIRSTLKNLEKVGPDWWCGYSYSWLGNLYARAFMGDKAAETLRIFSENFCLPNSFHVNGEQHNKGFSKMKYRPFTLEGNFAFAAGVQEMLIQSHTGIIHIFPAIPQSWKDVSFTSLRTRGAFLVSAQRTGGNMGKVGIISETGGICKLKNPFGTTPYNIKYSWKGEVKSEGEMMTIEFPKNGKVELIKQ